MASRKSTAASLTTSVRSADPILSSSIEARRPPASLLISARACAGRCTAVSQLSVRSPWTISARSRSSIIKGRLPRARIARTSRSGLSLPGQVKVKAGASGKAVGMARCFLSTRRETLRLSPCQAVNHPLTEYGQDSPAPYQIAWTDCELPGEAIQRYFHKPRLPDERPDLAQRPELSWPPC